MKKYKLRICEPILYEVKAENWEEASKKALELYRKDHDTWLGEIHPDPHIYEVKKSGKYPRIEEIVKQRVELGIAGDIEEDLYIQGNLDDDGYSDEDKQQLINEVKKAEKKKKAQPQPTNKNNADWLAPKPAKKK